MADTGNLHRQPGIWGSGVADYPGDQDQRQKDREDGGSLGSGKGGEQPPEERDADSEDGAEAQGLAAAEPAQSSRSSHRRRLSLILFATAGSTIALAIGGLFLPAQDKPVAGEGDYRAAHNWSVYHRPDCYHIRKFKGEVVAVTKAEAEIIGLRPCQDCIKPDARQQLGPLERSRLASGIRP